MTIARTDGTAGSVDAAAAQVPHCGRDLQPIAFLADAQREGIAGGLVTIAGVDGGTPRPLGAYMAVLSDGRHAGHISGGCVEPAIASELAPLLKEGVDQIVRFGKGSCYMDIAFPCGGGVDLLMHTCPRPEMLNDALARAERREPFAIAFDPARSRAELIDAGEATRWRDGLFIRRHLPRPRLVLIGRGPDLEVMARVAAAAEFELCVATPDQASATSLAALGVPVEVLAAPGQLPGIQLDPWTAVVLVFHEREWETALLAHAAAGPGFYVGALGSRRTHALRSAHLLAAGLPAPSIERIRGPIGLVDRARDPGTLALSVLAEVAAAWAEVERA